MSIDVRKIKKDFSKVFNSKVVYFDSACTTLVPDVVIDRVTEYYNSPSCHSRSNHSFANRTSKFVDETRGLIQKLIGAKEQREIIFTRNTTEAINIVSKSLKLKSNESILVSNLEHNSNLIPWLKKCSDENRKLVKFQLNKNSEFSIDEYRNLFKDNKIGLVSCFHISNITGTLLPIKEMISIAHQNGAMFLLDCAQSIYCQEIDVKELDVDFLCFSGHKMFGPSGIGVLYAKGDKQDLISPLCLGGHTVFDVRDNKYTLEESPNLFEAGLQNYSGIAGLGQAVKYLSKFSQKDISKHLQNLNELFASLMSNTHHEIIGPRIPEERHGIYNMIFPKMDSHEVSMLLDSSRNICVRSGVHCGHSWYNELDLKPSVRVSFSIYNSEEDVKLLANTLHQIVKLKN